MERIDFAVSPSGDVIFEENNIKMIEGREIYVQCFRQLFRTRLGEYFLNTEEGLDYEVFLGVKEIDEEAVMTALQEVGEQVQDFVRYDNVDYDYNRQQRLLRITFDALFVDGYRLEVDEEVIVNA